MTLDGQKMQSVSGGGHFGGNFIYIDQQNDLLVVLRWVPALEEVVAAVTAAIED